MIKIRAGLLLIAVMGLLGVSGCGGSSGPAEIYIEATELIEDGQAEKALEYLQIPVGMQAMLTPEKMKSALVESARKINDKGGISKIEVLGEKVTGITAVVITKTTYGDGEVEEDVTNMINVDGIWKIELEM